MSDAAKAFDPHRFETAVPYYARHRLAYPGRLIARVVDETGLEPGDAVMDLGCGPGTLSIPFALAGMRVTAIDPEPSMLAAARDAARAAGVAIDAREGSSFDLPAGIGPFRLVTMGRSFHWMDRAATLAALDGVVTADGALAFFDDDHPKTAENAWRQALRDLSDRYGRAEASHILAEKAPDFRSRESLLLDSAFGDIEKFGVVVRHERDIEDIVGLALSLSTSSIQALGERRAEFERELRAILTGLSPSGRFVEIADMSVQVARRNRASS